MIKCNLQSILDDKGISQRKLALALDCRYNTINDLCRNKTKHLPLQLLDDICTYLNIDISDILYLEK